MVSTKRQSAKRKSRKRAGGAKKPSLQQRMKEERKSVYLEAINEAAERVFAEKGIDRSRMQEIAAEAGVSLGTLYAVIDGKQSLLAGIHRTRIHEFLDCIRDASDAHDDTLASHIAALREGAQYFLDRPDFLAMCCRAGFGWAAPFPMSTKGKHVWDKGTSIPRDLFARGIAEGIYVDEDPELMARKMLALKQVDLMAWVEHGMEAPHEEVLDRLERQFIRAFCIHKS